MTGPLGLIADRPYRRTTSNEVMRWPIAFPGDRILGAWESCPKLPSQQPANESKFIRLRSHGVVIRASSSRR